LTDDRELEDDEETRLGDDEDIKLPEGRLEPEDEEAPSRRLFSSKERGVDDAVDNCLGLMFSLFPTDCSIGDGVSLTGSTTAVTCASVCCWSFSAHALVFVLAGGVC
jgi:hypothetical protein